MNNTTRVLGALCLGVLPLSGVAFWSWVGPVSHHQDYTAAAIGAPATFTFAGQTRSTSGQPYSFSQNAIDQINLAHAQADDPGNYQAVDHFDSEQLVGGLLQIALRRQELNRAVTPPISIADKQNAWNLLGFMIHAIQDFYAHSSWIEEGNVINIAGFGALTENSPPALIPPSFQAVSVGAIANPALCGAGGYPLLMPVNEMTTGYYDPLSAPTGKCDHGTLSQAIATCAVAGLIGVQGISKDSPCALYPLGPNHYTAASLATQETLDFVQSVVADLNKANNTQGFCALLDLPSNTPICGGSVVLTANPSWVVSGATVIFSVVVGPLSGIAAIPTGTVLVNDETGNTICTVTLTSTGTGTCSYVYPSTQPHTYTAAYAGNQTYSAAISPSINTAPYAVTPIVPPNGYHFSTYWDLSGVNSNGDIVGLICTSGECATGGSSGSSVTEGFVYHQRQFNNLDILAPTTIGGQGWTWPRGISESGSISTLGTIGFVLTPTSVSPLGYSTAPITPPAGYHFSKGTDLAGLNSSGDVVGLICTTQGEGECGFPNSKTSVNEGFIYHLGQFYDLSTIAPGAVSAGGGSAVYPVAISESGSILASIYNGGTGMILLKRTSSDPLEYSTTTIPSTLSIQWPGGVNSSGDIVGLGCTAGGGECGFENFPPSLINEGFIYHQGQYFNLTTIAPVLAGSSGVTWPTAISESGSISTLSGTAAYLLAAPYVPSFPIVVSITGLNGSLALQNSDGNTVVVTGTADLTVADFPAVLSGSAYSITITSQPSKQTCVVTNGSGFVSGALVTNVSVSCN